MEDGHTSSSSGQQMEKQSGGDRPGRDVTQIAIIVAVGLLVALAGSAGGRAAAGLGVHLWVAIAAFVINWVVFIPSFAARTEHFYDLTGSLTYLATTGLAVALGGPADRRSWLLAALIAIWASRLGTYLFRRVRQTGKDGRFDRIKQSPTRFLMTWTLQGLWVVFTAAAAHAAIASQTRPALGFWAVVGVIIWLAGFAVEVISDRQKAAFRNDPTNVGRFITDGLWAWSRHPNYFGEILLWIGIAVIAFPALRGWQLVTLISPVFVYLLLTRISGVPMLEKRADKRWGGDEGYEAYKAATPVLIPRPPAR